MNPSTRTATHIAAAALTVLLTGCQTLSAFSPLAVPTQLRAAKEPKHLEDSEQPARQGRYVLKARELIHMNPLY